jgi:Ni/Fe-hydrogenase subunit HybB-like protein
MASQFAPVKGKFWTPGIVILALCMTAAFIVLVARFTQGLGYTTNANDAYPWGIWIAVNVAGMVGLSAGGFTTGALAHTFHKQHYHDIVRPALFTALLGYTCVVSALLIDVGRYWNMISPMINWGTTSFLFAVAICVMISTTILYIECFPIMAEWLFNINIVRKSFIGSTITLLRKNIDKAMFLIVLVGIVFSCLHQSSLGALLLISPSKTHPLWFSPLNPLLFLISAIATAYPLVLFEHILVSKSLSIEPKMNILSSMAKYIPFLLGIYFILKIGDMLYRGTYIYLLDGTAQTNSFLVEIIVGLTIPLILTMIPKVRNSASLLFYTSWLAIFGVIINRINVFLVSFTPPYGGSYFPAVTEIIVSVGMIAGLMFFYKLAVMNLPIMAVETKGDNA